MAVMPQAVRHALSADFMILRDRALPSALMIAERAGKRAVRKTKTNASPRRAVVHPQNQDHWITRHVARHRREGCCLADGVELGLVDDGNAARRIDAGVYEAAVAIDGDPRHHAPAEMVVARRRRIDAIALELAKDARQVVVALTALSRELICRVGAGQGARVSTPAPRSPVSAVPAGRAAAASAGCVARAWAARRPAARESRARSAPAAARAPAARRIRRSAMSAPARAAARPARTARVVRARSKAAQAPAPAAARARGWVRSTAPGWRPAISAGGPVLAGSRRPTFDGELSNITMIGSSWDLGRMQRGEPPDAGADQAHAAPPPGPRRPAACAAPRVSGGCWRRSRWSRSTFAGGWRLGWRQALCQFRRKLSGRTKVCCDPVMSSGKRIEGAASRTMLRVKLSSVGDPLSG